MQLGPQSAVGNTEWEHRLLNTEHRIPTVVTNAWGGGLAGGGGGGEIRDDSLGRCKVHSGTLPI